MQLRPGIRLLDESPGDGPAIARGDRVRVRLAAWLNHAEQVQQDTSMTLVVGDRSLIPGVSYSLVGMRVGGHRRVRIAPHLAYAERGISGGIPPNAVLDYDIQVLEMLGKDADD